MPSRPHICFVAPTAWPVLSRATDIETVGGAEVQQCLVARSLASRGFRVSVLCQDYGQEPEVVIDGVTAVRCDGFRGGLPVVRAIHPRLTGLWATLGKIDADIYYQRSASPITGIVGLFSTTHGRPFVYAVAHDLDLARSETWRLFQRPGGRRGRGLFRLGLACADTIVVQHANQAADCQRWFGRAAAIVPSCCGATRSRAKADGVVLWASTFRAWKRPELFLELARRLPDVRFRFVGGPSEEPGEQALYAGIRDASNQLCNVEFVGFVAYADINSQFDATRVFVNTSLWEGFPNTFLQSWVRGIPTVSFAAPGCVTGGEPVVTVARDVDDMARAVGRLMTDDALWRETGERARAYVETFHTIDAATTCYEQVFSSALSRLRSQSRLVDSAKPYSGY